MVEKVQDVTSEHSNSGTPCGPTHPSTSASAGPGKTDGEPSNPGPPSRREIFDATVAGVQDHVLLPHLRSDLPPSKAYRRVAHTLEEFRRQEGEGREARLRDIWQRLTETRNGKGKAQTTSVGPVGPATSVGIGMRNTVFTREKAEKLQDIYDNELEDKCGKGRGPTRTRGPRPLIPWKDFYRYAEVKEAGKLNAIPPFRWFWLSDRNLIIELWHVFHDELDLDGNGHLDADELGSALKKAGRSNVSVSSVFHPLDLPVRSYRDPAISEHSLRIHDHFDLIAAFTCRQLPRV